VTICYSSSFVIDSGSATFPSYAIFPTGSQVGHVEHCCPSPTGHLSPPQPGSAFEYSDRDLESIIMNSKNQKLNKTRSKKNFMIGLAHCGSRTRIAIQDRSQCSRVPILHSILPHQPMPASPHAKRAGFSHKRRSSVRLDIIQFS
jgi:hypothetical protein